MNQIPIDESVDNVHNELQVSEEVFEIPLHLIDPDPEQPRKHFPQDRIKELATSIVQEGLIQPILVQPIDGRYKIIAGELRYRAHLELGKDTIRAIVKEIDEDTKVSIQLAENQKRNDLNSIEEAEYYKFLVDSKNYTHQKIADLIGKSRTYVTNKLRLLKLPQNVREDLINGVISEGHARSLISKAPEEIHNDLVEIKNNNLSVRDAEKLGHDVTRETIELDKSKIVIADQLLVLQILQEPDGSIKHEVEVEPLVKALISDLRILRSR